MPTSGAPRISLAIPIYNEEESLPELCAWIHRVATANDLTYEAILVDDGSTDKSWDVIVELAAKNPLVKGIRLRRNYGKSAAMNVAFDACEGDVVITMDADLQDSPDEIPGLYSMIVNDKFDMVSGWKKKRHDPLSKTIPTKLFNWATRKMSGIYLNDFNCGIKAYRKEVVKNIEVYGEMHRYIPVIAKAAGFKRIGEKVVEHRARKYNVTKFGIERYMNGFLDLLSITFISQYNKKPMHFFGLLGVFSVMIGVVLSIFVIVNEFVYTDHKVADQPIFYFSILAFIMSTQFFLTGFLAEMIARNAYDRNAYQVGKRVNFDKDPKADA